MDKTTKEFLGGFSLEKIGEVQLELGGWLKAAAHGKRLGLEAAAGVVEWAHKHLDFESILWS